MYSHRIIGRRYRPLSYSLAAVLAAAFTLAACRSSEPMQQPGRQVDGLEHSIIPKPVSVEFSGTGRFVVNASTVILVEPGNAEAGRIGQFLARLIGTTVESTPRVSAIGASIPAGSIVLTTEGASGALGTEGYELEVTPERVTITAPRPAGLFYGVQTLRQLLPPMVEYTATLPAPMEVPAVRIVDQPRFGWRGAMLDVARHFLEPEDVKAYIDLMAMYKMNRLHLHLADDQGWRIEVPSWPRLAEYGGSTEVGGGEGGYYTRDEYREIDRYAQDRFITIVPEIDLPGHTNAALASYAELNCDGVAPPLYTGIEVGFSTLCVDKEITYRFVDDIVREIGAITTGPYFHIGGDEVMKLTQEQYNSFIERAQEIVRANGKQAVGWDEIAHARLLPNTIVQHWRPEGSQEGIAEAVAAGATVVLSPADRIYIDMKYDSTTTLGLAWAGFNDVRDAYEWDPADRLPGVSESAIQGVEAPMWSETLGTLDDFEYMAFPRLAGVAEIGWSPTTGRSWNEYRLRLGAQAPRWSALGINFYRAPEIPWKD